jgi:GWxTD domain-containing protein
MTASYKWLIAGVLGALGCSHAPTRQGPDPLRNYNVEAVEAGDVRDFRPVYQQMGTVSSAPPISFVARTAAFATPATDTTLVVVAISLPNRGITFQHDGPMFHAEYEVEIVLRRDSAETQRVTALDTVKVATLKETNRTDESLIFRRALRMPPGIYAISYRVRDVFGSRQSAAEGVTTVPRFLGTSLSAPVVVYEATPRKKLADLPQYLPAPRAAVTFGVDATLPVYMEAYGTQITTPLLVSLRDQKGGVVWHDTAWLAQRSGFASGIIHVPLARADVGIFTVVASYAGTSGTGGNTSGISGGSIQNSVKTPIFIGFGPDLPVMSFNDMVDYLRFFATYSKLHALDVAKGEARGAAWSAFLKSTDPTPDSPENEALQDYFRRIRDANYQFRMDGPEGWLTDRGSAYVALGEPDFVQDREGYSSSYSSSISGRTRFLIWEYRDLQARIIFYDETGGGQWRMVPSSASLFRSLVARRIR